MTIARLVVVDRGEDRQSHWFRAALRDVATDEILDADRFRFIKATRAVLLNPPHDPADPPRGWEPSYENREGNIITYDRLVRTVARHFMRRQPGSLVPRIPGRVWTPPEYTRRGGTDVIDSDSQIVRLQKMISGGFDVPLSTLGDPELVRVRAHEGTVAVISVDWDRYTDETLFCFTSANLIVGKANDTIARFPLRFPISSIPDEATIDDVDVGFDVYQNTAGTADIQHYHTDGTTDPSGDTCANQYARCAGQTPYVNDYAMTPTGNHSVDLGTDADADVEAALTGSYFSLGFNENGSSGTNDNSWIYGLAHATGPEADLTVTYTVGAVAAAMHHYRLARG